MQVGEDCILVLFSHWMPINKRKLSALCGGWQTLLHESLTLQSVLLVILRGQGPGCYVQPSLCL